MSRLRYSNGGTKEVLTATKDATGNWSVPIDATMDVFGVIVDSYTMTESVQDEITVRIVYEGRADEGS
ncbi:type I restriction-modification system subunit R, partial [Salmonella enterica subsp. enterica serovar Enteritidis str. 648898 4-5]